MRNSLLDLKVLIFFCISFLSKEMYAQLGFCQGNSGDPIFTETFGTGTIDSPLPAGTTTYNYANGQPPNDGLYTVSSNSDYFDWFDINDHTIGDTNGRMLIVNSSFTAGEFYNTTINGLCENTTYEFSSWLLNLAPAGGFCGAGAIPVNVRFEIWDNTDTNILASGTTGNIFGSPTAFWDQYALVFQTVPGQTSVILKMINNSSGGCGNDLAIDDIVFKSCGDSITLDDTNNNDAVTICSSQAPFSTTISATPDNVVFNSHFYQWQTSNDGINWTDILGETNASFLITGVTTTTFYRAKVAEFAANLINTDCITLSDVYEITVNEAPIQPTIECWETATFNDTTCSWTVTGTQPAAPTGLECWETTTFNNTTCTWDITGTQPTQPTIECWETATFNNATCTWTVTGTQPIAPTGLECWEIATFNTISCLWEITGTQPVEPTGLECWEITTFNNTTCVWDVTGIQPVQPTTECWEAATFNNATCSWIVTGMQPAAPAGLECWETTTFNNTTCTWDITGIQPVQPTTECWETATFNNATCSWIVTGTQPVAPTGLECWETTTFNNTTCVWEIGGIQPAEPTGLECWQTTTFNNATCTWDVTGTQPVAPINLECWQTTVFNDVICTWEIIGTQPLAPTDLLCWQTTEFNDTICDWEVFGTQPVEVRDEFLFLCEGETLTLEATSTINNASYDWDSGALTPSISVNIEGTYQVEVTDGCFTEIITFNVTQIDLPVIESVITDSSSILINLANQGLYQYSLDGVNYQFSNVFSSKPTGLYTIYVKSNDCDFVVTQQHFHFFIQKFITPNADGKNDVFALNIEQNFTATEVYIFDRYGKLLFSAVNRNVRWDGTFKGNPLPTSDYWYRIILDGQEFKGHFALKR